MGIHSCAQVGTAPKGKPEGPKAHLGRRLAARDALIFPHLPPEQDAKLAASAGVTEFKEFPELKRQRVKLDAFPLETRLHADCRRASSAAWGFAHKAPLRESFLCKTSTFCAGEVR